MTTFSPERALMVAGSAAGRLVAMVQPDGRFQYRYALNDPTFVNVLYSEVRHAAVVWNLCFAERSGVVVAGLAEAIDRAALYMEERLFRPYGTSGALCVLDEGLIKLSGSALGVAAEMALMERPGADTERHRGFLQRLARHVASQRESDGDFLPVRVPGPIPKAHPGRDSLTPGQGILALALAAEATGDPEWRAAALDSADRFASRGYGLGAMSHWLLYAVEATERLEHSDARLAYGKRLADSIMAMSPINESTPLACASEGLLAYARALRALGGHEDELRRVLDAVAVNLKAQLRFFHPTGAFVASAARQEVRIDIIGHNAMAFLGYARLMQGR